MTLIAFVSFGLASCDDDENTLNEETGIVGTWEGDGDEYHYPIVTINADGTYVWEWAGIARFKDEGKYTYDENKNTIVMKPSKYYEWDDEKNGYVVNKEPWDNSPRNIKILDLTPGVMLINLSDYFMGGSDGDGFDFVLYRKGLVQNIKAQDLDGTWESYEPDGSLSERVILSGSNFTAYDVWTTDTILCAEKSTGTWSISGSVITVKPSAVMFSYERVNNDYVYSAVNPLTLEAETWTRASWNRDEYSQRVYLSDDKKTLYVAGVVFKKIEMLLLNI